jgi:hypothetical protein
MSQPGEQRHSRQSGGPKSAIPSVAAVVLFLVSVYALSYAPAFRLVRAGNIHAPVDWWIVYRPMEWLIDETPLQTPLFVWARYCRVHDEMEVDTVIRRRNRLKEWATPICGFDELNASEDQRQLSSKRSR